MFGGKRRVEEDLERIRRANLPPRAPEAAETMEAVKHAEHTGASEPAGDAQNREAPVDIGTKEIIALILTAFSYVLPYVGIFAVLLLGIWLVLQLLS